MNNLITKKVTFYYDRDKSKSFFKVVKVDSKMSNRDIVKNLFLSFNDSINLSGLFYYDDYIYNSIDGISTSFEVKDFEVVDLTEKE